MIVSASYRTDIPAFYAAWFQARLVAGWVDVVNPYGGPPSRVDLGVGAVDGFVFWTRNLAPFAPALEEVAARRHPFVVQFTLTAYPRCLERSVIGWAAGVEQARATAERFGPRAMVWRYDPITVTSRTPPSWHRETFAWLAAALKGVVDEVVVSFLQPYRKTARNLDAAARRHGFSWRDPEVEEKRALLGELAAIAAERRMTLTLCAQPGIGPVPGTRPAACVDVARLSDIAGRPLRARLKGNRPGCLCAESRDIGAYDSCPHGCAYCYAVASRERARARFSAHDPAGSFLDPPKA